MSRVWGDFLQLIINGVDYAQRYDTATRYLCTDIGLDVESLPTTNVKISRNFSGVGLHKVIDTLFTLASETTGERYHIRFVGTALQVIKKPDSSNYYLDPAANVYTSTNTIDMSDYCNTVDIHDETGTLIRTVGGGEELAGMLRQHITQLDGEDASGEAEQLLEDNGGTQTVTVTCPGNVALVTGNAVIVRETAAGVDGLFWIDGDTHTWSNGQYNVSLDLNFKNIMNENSSGTEVIQ